MRKPLVPGGRYVEFRSGLGGFVWEGMATKIDPGGSPPSRPRWLENVRVQGGSIISRPDFAGPGAAIPAVTQYNTSIGVTPTVDGVGELSRKNRLRFHIIGQDHWDPAWAAEFNSVGGTRLWWGATPPMTYYTPPGPGWQQVATGAQFGFIDTDSDPVFNLVAKYDSDDSWPPCIEKFNTEIYIGDFGCLRKVFPIQSPPGLAPQDVLSQPADVIVLPYPGFRTTAMVEYNGKLWLLLTDPSNTVDAEIWSYDGLTATAELTLSVSGANGGSMAVYKNQLVVTVVGEALIHVRSAAGVWSAPALGGFDSSAYLNNMAQYRDKLYIMSGTDKIYSFDGATLALAHTIAPAIDPRTGNLSVPNYARCCVVMNDILYYGWTNTDLTTITLGTSVCIGRYDGDDPSWVDFYTRNYSIFNWGMNFQTPEPTTAGAITAMAQYRGRLWVAVTGVPSGNSYVLTHSIQYAPYDGWFVCDSAQQGDPDLVTAYATNVADRTGYNFGPGHLANGRDFGPQTLPQIAYLRSI